jgi:hypothetical protein
VYKANYTDIIKANGLDAYFFVRFLRMMVKILLPIWFFSWAVLLPIDSVHSRVGNNTGLALLTYGNISPDKSARYAAHLILVYFFTGAIVLKIWIEPKSQT